MKKITVTFYWNYRYYCHLVFWRAPIGESKWHGRSRYLNHLQLGDYIDPALIKKFEKKKQAIKSITKPLILMKPCIQKNSARWYSL